MLDKYTGSFLSFLLAHYTVPPLGGGTTHLSGREAVAFFNDPHETDNFQPQL